MKTCNLHVRKITCKAHQAAVKRGTRRAARSSGLIRVRDIHRCARLRPEEKPEGRPENHEGGEIGVVCGGSIRRRNDQGVSWVWNPASPCLKNWLQNVATKDTSE